MRRTIMAMLTGLSAAFWILPADADIYKYVDQTGNVYFTDTPLKGNRYQLEWHREANKLIRDSTPQIVSMRSQRQSTRPLSGNQTERRASVHNLVLANARRYRLSPGLIHAVIRAESGYNPAAVSPAGAQGLMQLMPGTAARYRVSDSFDPHENVRGGAAYLRDLLNMFDQDLRLALAGYNAGEGAVIKYGRQIPPYAETQDYVRKVLEFFRAEQPASLLTAR
ncbi:lytic transglycosylase [Chromatium weissei]|nr:lytic transglycosylase [Chromatium weissei]